MLYGKLSPTGILTDIGYRSPVIWGDGSTDVILVALPAVQMPCGYDAPNKLAIANPSAVAAILDTQRLADITTTQWKEIPCYVDADAVTTVVTFADIPGLAFNMNPNEKWNVEFNLFCLGSTGGIKIQLTGPANPTRAVMCLDGNTTAVAVAKTTNMKVSPAYGSPSIAYIINVTPFTGIIQIYINIVNGPNAGITKLQFASATAGQTNKVIAGSFGLARRAG